ncbi:hypothetical protein ACVOMV_05395 [Mesorhizobium atlanticum]
MLHTLYGQSLEEQCAVLHRIASRLDLTTEPDGTCTGVVAWNLDDAAPSTASRPRWWCWRPAAMAAA